MNKMNMLAELFYRLQQESPDFFKKVGKYSIFIIVAAAIPLALEWGEVLVLPGKLDLILMGIISFFLGSGGTAATAVQTNDVVGGGKRPTDPPPPKP